MLTTIKESVLIMDGAMGSMIQGRNLKESDFKADRFAAWDFDLAGCYSVLSITQADLIKDIHLSYLNAGADIITTNSFNSNLLALKKYGLQRYVYEINYCAAQLARQAVEESGYSRRYVAGSVSPIVSSCDIIEEEYLYETEIEALVNGGVDIILFETFLSSDSARKAIAACEKIIARSKHSLPIMVSVTISNSSHKLYSGETIEEFVAAIESYDSVVSIGLNCLYERELVHDQIERLARSTSKFISLSPSAGLPQKDGTYCDQKEQFTQLINDFISNGVVNIVGGCCGTDPVYISNIRALKGDIY